MKRLLLLGVVGLSGVGVAAVGNPALVQNQIVYLLPMSNGFDQYLATELTKKKLVTVTTDPKQATAIMTDRLGEGLELKMKEIYEKPVKLSEKEKEKDKQEIRTNLLPPRISSFGGGKGNVYLVDTSSRKVLWSTFIMPKRTTPGELTRTAEKVTHQLRKDSTPPSASH